MSNSYVESFSGRVDFPKPFQRTGKFPLDRTDLFGSYEDAVKYAAGNREDPDSRGLCGVSYIGQTITVYENGEVADYKILADRTLRKIGESTVGTVRDLLPIGDLSKAVELPTGCTPTNIQIYDSVSGEQVFTEICCTGSSVTVSLAESYPNPLDIVISYCTA